MLKYPQISIKVVKTTQKDLWLNNAMNDLVLETILPTAWSVLTGSIPSDRIALAPFIDQGIREIELIL